MYFRNIVNLTKWIEFVKVIHKFAYMVEMHD